MRLSHARPEGFTRAGAAPGGWLVAMLTVISLLTACGRTGEAPPNAGATPGTNAQAMPVRLAEAGYVDDDACVTCHRKIGRSYHDVAMSRSVYRPTPAKLVEDFVNNHFFNEASGRHYDMVRDGEGFLVRRYMLDEYGKRVHELEQRVDWVIGSGNHVRSYVYRAPSGELFQVPIAWYADGGWNMAPGFDRKEQADFTRQIGRDCLFCHNAYPDVLPDNDRFGEPATFPETLPEGIGCQRCHGPGQNHIRLAGDPHSTLGDVSASIINPANLDPHLRDDVCLQCHLQPKARHISYIRRFGRSDYSYRPGEPLQDYLVHFDLFEQGDQVDAHGEDFEINQHPYRLFQSVCYVKSGGSISCLTCHDPHYKVPAEQRASFYRDRCLTCHKTADCGLPHMPDLAPYAGVPADDCVACHMGRRHPQDVSRVVMTDHRILRRPEPLRPVPVSVENQRLQNPRIVYYDGSRAPAEPDASLYLAINQALEGVPNGIAALQRAIRDLSPQAVEPYAYLATALAREGEHAEAASVLQTILEKEDRAWAHIGMARALIALKQYDKAIEQLHRSIELNPNDPNARRLLGLALRETGRTDEARAEFRQAIRLRPTGADAHMDLAALEARQARFDEAIALYRRTLALDPSRSVAYEHLATIQSSQGRFTETIQTLRLGAKLASAPAGICDLLATLYLTVPDPALRSTAEGLAYARRAVEADPDAGSAATTLAAALLFNERCSEAITTAAGARVRAGDEANCLLVMAVGQLRVGQTAEARQSFADALAAAQKNPSPLALRQMLLDLARRELRQ